MPPHLVSPLQQPLGKLGTPLHALRALVLGVTVDVARRLDVVEDLEDECEVVLALALQQHDDDDDGKRHA